MKPAYNIFTLYLAILIGLVACNQNSQYDVTGSRIPNKIDFNFHVKPILSDRCYACHGPDEGGRKGNLRLDTEEGAFASLDSLGENFAIVPGNVSKSLLVHRITTDNLEDVMPPQEFNLTLSEREIKILKRWIEQGAEWKEHWSFIPPAKSSLPEVNNKDWVNNEIDNYVLRKLEDIGVEPALEESKEKMLRRATFDLTGLPPSLEELEAFINDDSDNAYEKVVDRLLASQAYGERMATDWLDVARYADSHGYQDDRPRTMWPWRDWVIKAFNENLAFDKFSTWQIAGDLLPEPTYEQKLATGFNRNHAITQEGGVVKEEYLTEYAADRTQTFSTAFLGITMECARCHDHKYDPITQKDYYGLMGFFNNIKEEEGQINYQNLSPRPSMLMEDTVSEARALAISTMISDLEEQVLTTKNNTSKGFEAWSAKGINKERIEKELAVNLIAYAKLDEQEGWRFHNEANPTLNGQVNIKLPESIPYPDKTEGINGNALKFDGSNFLTLGDIADFDFYDRFSFGGWIKHSAAHDRKAAIFSRRNGEINRQGYDLVLTLDNRLEVRMIHDRDSRIEVETTSTIPKDTWAHVFVTYDGSGKASGFNIYINGDIQRSKIIQDNLERGEILNGNTFLVGNWNHRNRILRDLYGFNGGTVDEIRVYKNDLTALEVRYLAKQNLSPHKKESYEYYLKYIDKGYQLKNTKLDSLRRIDTVIPRVMIMEEADSVKPTFILSRGVYDAPLDKVERNPPESILKFDNTTYPSNRLGLSQWLLNKNNPLTSRVIVNRYWQMYFGKGLVGTPEDFGNQGDLPQYPELLDWLAVEFRESGWDVKAMQKLIVTSTTYRQSSKVDVEKYKFDPQNELLARGPSTRLSAEMLRDQALANANLLNKTVGGKWVKPYQPSGIWKELANQIGENKYRNGQGAELYRRSLYTYFKRTIPPATMITLDAPERAVCTVKRQATSTPLQSLILLNDPQYVEASRVMAQEILTNQQGNLTAWIDIAFRKITSRRPNIEEQELLSEIYQSEMDRFSKNEEEARSLLEIGDSPLKANVALTKTAAFTVVVSTIFNLDESKYKG